MTVSMVLFWGLVIFGIVAMARSWGRGDQVRRAPLTAEEILAERFARGEIDEVEYRERLDVLGGRTSPTRP
jgi:putative membrane protein